MNPRDSAAAAGYDDAVTRAPAGWDVDSPVRAEGFVA
jgi:hypothetical protein